MARKFVVTETDCIENMAIDAKSILSHEITDTIILENGSKNDQRRSPMASREQLRAVAQNCNAFRSREEQGIRASMGAEEITCENCIHFTEDRRCDIDLVDEILIRITDDV